MSRDPEDLLRDALRAGDDPVGAGSFDDVRARARRLDRRARLLKTGAAVIVILAAIGVSIPLLSGDDDNKQRVITSPGRTTTTLAPVEDEPIGIWPFVTGAEADDMNISPDGFYVTNATETAVEFVRIAAGAGDNGAPAPDVETIAPAEPHEQRSTVVVVTIGSRRMQVVLRRLGSSDRWSVVSVQSDGLVLDEPSPNALESSPVHVAGRATAFEGTVLVRVTDRGPVLNELGKAVLTGEMGLMKPFSGDVSFQPRELGYGAVIAYTVSAKDGRVEQLSAVPIRWAPPEKGAINVPQSEYPIADGQIVAVVNEAVHGGSNVDDLVLLEDGEIRLGPVQPARPNLLWVL